MLFSHEQKAKQIRFNVNLFLCVEAFPRPLLHLRSFSLELSRYLAHLL